MAALTAAGLSLVNVGISARLAGRGHREQWRRDQERPVVARCLALSADALGEWWDASAAKQEADADAPLTSMDPHWHKGRQLLLDIRYEVAQLDLLASRAVRQAAGNLFEAHETEVTRLLLGAKPGQDDYDARVANRASIEELQRALVERARADLGLGLPVPPRSVLGKLFARPPR